jgi:lipopolysaccharide export LptBFGC system permease protein LptF
MKINKIMLIVLILTLTLIPVYSQQAKVKIEQSGYGQDEREAHFTIYNTGEIPITDVTFYVDSKPYKTINGLSNQVMDFMQY